MQEVDGTDDCLDGKATTEDVRLMHCVQVLASCLILVRLVLMIPLGLAVYILSDMLSETLVESSHALCKRLR